VDISAKLNKNKLFILIADDDEVDRKMLRRSLGLLNTDISELVDGQNVIETLSKKKYDCLILDYMLSDCDGLELVKTIRDKNIETPIVVTTGHGDETLAVNFLKAGAQDYIPKDKINEGTICQSVIGVIRLKEISDSRKYFEYFYEKRQLVFILLMYRILNF
jgi:two-component system sensor histidine kinase/response regulator